MRHYLAMLKLLGIVADAEILFESYTVLLAVGKGHFVFYVSVTI
jgi:hypothetical protein